MDRLKNIVVGVDFSRYSASALAQAMRIADWNEAKLHVVHVIEPSITTNLADSYGVAHVENWGGFREIARERILKMISAARELVPPTDQTQSPGVEIDVQILFGNPFVHMLRQVRDVSAEFLVLGSNGSSDPSQVPSVLATKCVHKAPTKVMLVRESSAEPFKHIVACVCFSDTCHLVVRQAIRVARQNNSSLDVLHIYGLSRETAGQGAPESQQQLRDCIDGQLREIFPPFGSEISGLKVEIHPAKTQDEKTDLVEFLRSSGADLVVLGTRGRPELRGTPKATTVERIVQESPCSVLVIKPENFEYEIGGAPRAQ